jgi:hypothetical protein
MPELTPNIGLKKPLGNETVSRAAYRENLDLMDVAFGNRTPDQTQAPVPEEGSVTGTLAQILSWLANRIKAITGAANWWDAPAATLSALWLAALPVGAEILWPGVTPPAGFLEENGSGLTRATYANLYAVLGGRFNRQFTADAATDRLTCTAHGIATGTAVDVWSDGTLPAPLAAGTVYYVRVVDANTLTLHPTAADASANTNIVNITTTGSSVHTISPTTTFNLPDARGEFVRMWDHGRGVDTGRAQGSSQADDLKSHNHIIWPVFTNPFGSGGSGVNNASGNTTLTNPTTQATGGTETRPRNVARMLCIKY